MSDELHKEADEWALAAVNNIDRKFLSNLSKTAQKLSLIIMLYLKNRKACKQARQDHCLSNEVQIKVDFLTKKMNCSISTIERALNELVKVDKLKGWSRISRSSSNKPKKVSLQVRIY